MATSTEEFAALLERVHQGDESALGRLVQGYEPEVRLIARLRLGPGLRCYLDSMDLVQSVHRSLLRGLRQHKFDISTPAKLLALAATVVRRKIARHWRHLRHEQAHRAAHINPDEIEQALSREASPSETAALHDQLSYLLDGLKEKDRRLIELRLEGYSTVEVAHQLGVDTDSLRVRLARLRKRLRSSGRFEDWL
jgi:RNA polymerase sigma factor (sigma-70 family)